MNSENLGRRNFIAALGGLMATSALPSSAADDPSLFPKRGTFERMNLAYRHIHIGLERHFSVLHISDTHLTEWGPDETAKKDFAERRRRTFGGRQQSALFSSLEWAKKNADYVLHTGDLVDFQSQANFDLVRRAYGEAASSMFGCVGNHEFQRRNPGEDLKGRAADAQSRIDLAKAFPFDVVFQSTVAGGVNFVAIEQTGGCVVQEQVERFAAEVKKGLPIVLCMHVPFYTDEIWLANERYWTYPNRKFSQMPAKPDVNGEYGRQKKDSVTRDFIAYLKSEKLLRAILAGHLHFTFEDRFSPTAVECVVGGNFMFHGEELLFT